MRKLDLIIPGLIGTAVIGIPVTPPAMSGGVELSGKGVLRATYLHLDDDG